MQKVASTESARAPNVAALHNRATQETAAIGIMTTIAHVSKEPAITTVMAAVTPRKNVIIEKTEITDTIRTIEMTGGITPAETGITITISHAPEATSTTIVAEGVNHVKDNSKSMLS
jgi:hypothetical protein